MKRNTFIHGVTFSGVFFLLLFFGINSLAQVGGISASKIGTYCVQTVPARDLEFEPSFGFGKSYQNWNSDYKLENAFNSDDSVETFSEMGFRFTYGLTDRLEVGMAAPVDASVFDFGLKYLAIKAEKSGIAFITGITSPITNGVYDKSKKDSQEICSFNSGLVFSYEFSEKLLYDFDIQFRTLLEDAKNDNHFGVFINSDLGYYVSDDLQLICGASYFNNFYEESKRNNSLLDIHPGISYETGENFLIVVGSPIEVLGRNEPHAFQLSIAFTCTIR